MNRAFRVTVLGLLLAASSLGTDPPPGRMPVMAGLFAEVIVYHSPDRPPIFEEHIWDEEKHWQLNAVYFDSDGD